MRYTATESEEIQRAMLSGRMRELGTDQYLEMLFALHLGLREAVFRLAEHVERLEARLGPEDDG
jgi:hypothetical protein